MLYTRTEGESQVRQDLVRWEWARPCNLYTATPNLARVLRLHVGEGALATIESRLVAFGRTIAQVVEPAVRTLERRRDLPVHVPYDGLGRRVERIEFHPAYHEAGRAVWASGLLASPDTLEQAALFYLLAHAGEGGHACPVACTAGLIRALRGYGDDDLRERFLPQLLETDYDRCHRASQFLTEIQGGSDVGANLTRAVPDPAQPGLWRITGEKWFCSVADADQVLVTARPEGAPPGTRGLGCFLVPRTWEGDPNGFAIRRLKDKLGTRAMASAEIDFAEARAFPIGRLDEGFKITVGVVLNTSRWLNALGSAGIMRRAYLEAATFASHRTAFGAKIADFPLVRETLAVMKAEEQAALASTMELTALVDRIDRGVADDDDRAVHRVLVNANKYLTSIAATDVVHRAIEVLGGNGTIEDFSPLPRLYRDAIVFESWEGTHNVLCEQVRRDLGKLEILEPLTARIRARLGSLSCLAREAAAVGAALDELEPRIRRCVAEEAVGLRHFRRRLELLTRIVQATCLLTEADADTAAGEPGEKAEVAAFFIRRHLVPGFEPEDDPEHVARVDAVLGVDAG